MMSSEMYVKSESDERVKNNAVRHKYRVLDDRKSA